MDGTLAGTRLNVLRSVGDVPPLAVTVRFISVTQGDAGVSNTGSGLVFQ